MSVEICYRDKDGLIVAWDVGMSEEDVKEMLEKHPDYYRSTTEVG